MLILGMRTDRPEAELYLYEENQEKASIKWEAHRKLAETIHLQIKALLDAHGLSLKDLKGVAVYKGPGSFTGLRIGISVANALAESLKLTIVGIEGEDWLMDSVERLASGQDDKVVSPEYGAPVHITQQKK